MAARGADEVSVMAGPVNGWLVALRFLTPLMVGILLAQFHWAQADQREFRSEVKSHLAKVQTSLDNHIKTDFSELKNRLTVIETMLTVTKR